MSLNKISTGTGSQFFTHIHQAIASCRIIKTRNISYWSSWQTKHWTAIRSSICISNLRTALCSCTRWSGGSTIKSICTACRRVAWCTLSCWWSNFTSSNVSHWRSSHLIYINYKFRIKLVFKLCWFNYLIFM